MNTDNPILQTRIKKATAEIARRYGVDPAALHWEPTSDGAACGFKSNRRQEYRAEVWGTTADKNVVAVYAHGKDVVLDPV
jgi:hypothetical protein